MNKHQLPVTFDPNIFSRQVHRKMKAEKLSFREAAAVTGVGYNTLYRIVSLRGTPNIQNYLTIKNWLEKEEGK